MTNNKAYFFHIPSTGGRFFYKNTANLLRFSFYKKGIQPTSRMIFSKHISVPKNFDSSQLSYLIIRDPVARTISHYLHLYKEFSVTATNKSKKEFLNYLEENPNDSLINYQTKFLSIDNGLEISTCDKSLPPVNSLKKAKKSLKKVKNIFKSTDLSFELVKHHRQHLADYLGIKNEYPDAQISSSVSSNIESKKLYSLLTNSEIKYIQDLMYLDMEIFESSFHK